MRHEKIFKNEDGSRVKIAVEVRNDIYHSHSPIEWDFHVLTCAPIKRKWTSPVDTNDYSFRRLSMEERASFVRSESAKLVSIDRLMEVANELYEMIKPDFNVEIEGK